MPTFEFEFEFVYICGNTSHEIYSITPFVYALFFLINGQLRYLNEH